MPHVVHHAIDIAAPPSLIWEIFSDLATWPRWFPRAGSARSPDADPWRPGGRIEVELVVPVAGKIPLRLDVTEVKPGRLARWVGEGWGIRGDHRYEFDEKKSWTRVTSHEEFSAGLAASMAIRLARSRLDDEVHQSLAKLRDLVEAARKR